MGTEVLRPQISLVDRIRNSPAVFQRRRNNHRKPPSRPEQRRKSGFDDVKTAKIEMCSEKVTILRRGESLDSKIRFVKSPSRNDGDVVGSQDPPPGTSGDGDVYAGSATFVVSPSPSSLPFPSFSRKKKGQVVPIDDSATRDLRRLLRLEL